MTTIRIADVDVSVERAEAHLKQLEQQLGRTVSRADGLAAALRAAQGAIDEDARTTERLTAALRRAEPEVQSLGARLRALGQTDLSGRLRSWAQGMAAPYMAASQLGGQVVSLGRTLLQTAVQSEAHDRAMRRLGSAYHLVRQATNDTVSAQDALRAQQTLVQGGLQVTGEQLATITRAARDYALATGTETTQALEQLTDALRGGEEDGLQRFNLAVSAGGDRTRTFADSLRTLADRQRGTGAASRTLAEDMEALGRGFSTMVGHMARAVTQLGPVQAALRALGGAIASVNEHFEGEASRDRMRAESAQRNERNDRLDAQNRRLGGMNLGDIRDLDGWERDTVAGARTPAMAQLALDMVRRTRAQRRAEAARRAQAAADQHGLQQWGGLASAGVEGGFAIGSDPESSGGNGLAELRREVAAARAVAMVVGQIYETAERRRGESTERRLRREIALNQQLVAGARARIEAERELAAEMARQEIAERAARGRMAEGDKGARLGQYDARRASESASMTELFRQQDERNPARQFEQAFGYSAGRTVNHAEMMAQGVSAAFQTMTGSVKTHLAAVIEGRESLGDALRGIAHDTLLSLATEATGQAIMETARGIAKVAASYGADPTAYGHFAAAASFAGVAAIAGIGAAVTTPPSASAGGGASAGGSQFASAGGGSAANDNGGGGVTYVVNMNGAPFMTREDLHDAINRGGSLAGARGNTPDYFRQSERRARMG
jgi:hypothetical protein